MNRTPRKDRAEAEWGSTGSVRFLTEENVSAMDSNGNEILCACGKKSSMSFIGEHNQYNLCTRCYEKRLAQGLLE